MFWAVEKLGARIKELDKYRYRDLVSIGTFQSMEDEKGAVGTRSPSEGTWKTMQTGDRWEGRDRYLWLHTKVEIPSAWKGCTVLGLFDFGKTGGGGNSGFESLLYLNGEPYQGVDMNHQEVFLDQKLAGKTIELCFRLWSGLEGGGQPTNQEHQLWRLKVISILFLGRKVAY